jgi:hypothetical protein
VAAVVTALVAARATGATSISLLESAVIESILCLPPYPAAKILFRAALVAVRVLRS